MAFQSILGVKKLEQMIPEDIIMPKFFCDLNLDQIADNIMEEQKDYDLRRYYYFQADKEDISYRQGVLKELEKDKVYQSIVDFSIRFRKVKEYLNNCEETKNTIQKHKFKLDSAYHYILCLEKLRKDLGQENIETQGFQLFQDWLDTLLHSEAFLQLKESTLQLIKQFDEMKFHIEIKKDKVLIQPDYIEDDYGKQLQDIFGEVNEEEHFPLINPFNRIELSDLEEAIMKILKKQYTNSFKELSEFDQKYKEFIDPVILEFEHEIQFYMAFCAYRNKMMESKFHFCYPEILDKEEFRIIDSYDLALAIKNSMMKKEVVFNDCFYEEGERFLVITGPNQGGKTTFGRAIGQIIYLASLGLMVPARTAIIPLFSGIYTHFAMEENIDSGAGKLKEELVRLKEIMNRDTKRSFVIFNEIFTSATSYDAYIMGKRVIDHFSDIGCLGLYVTHIYELTKNDNRVGSLVASLLDEDSNVRTFKINRKVADGRSYANTIVAKYHLTYQEIKERIK